MAVASFDDQNLGGIQLAGALGSAIGAAFFLPGVSEAVLGATGFVLKTGAKAGWAGLKTTARVGAVAGRGIAAGFRSGAIPKAAYGTAAGTLGNLVRTTRTIAGGSIYTAARVGSWVYNHPALTTAMVAPVALGAAATTSWMYPNRPHGTPTRQPVSNLMDVLNASGDIVLGMHNSR